MSDLEVFIVAVRNWRAPYTGLFFNPPWSLIALAPYAFLPQWMFILLMILGLLYLVKRERLSWLGIASFLLSSPVLIMVYAKNIDWMVLLGLYLPAQIGIPLLLIKPQLTIGYVVHWLVWGKHRTITIAILAVLLTVSWFGWRWPSQIATPIGEGHDHSLFPRSLLVGIPLLAYAIVRKDSRLALLSSPFLAPFCGGNSWVGGMLVVAQRWPVLAWLATAGTWAYVPLVHKEIYTWTLSKRYLRGHKNG